MALTSHYKNFCCDGAVPVWVLLVTYQLAGSGGVDMSPCLPLIIKCLRSSEGRAKMGQRFVTSPPLFVWLTNFTTGSSSGQSVQEEVIAGLGSQGGSNSWEHHELSSPVPQTISVTHKALM